MSQTVLQLDNVEFRRNRRVIITDVNLTINAGERWVLFGPNGIGKSTAVGMLATRTFPSEGRVFILGHQLGKYDVFKPVSYTHLDVYKRQFDWRTLQLR